MSRLWLIKDKDTLLLHGSLGDTSDLACFEGMLNDQIKVDLSQLEFASWIGIQRLLGIFANQPGPVPLRGIRYETFQFFRLFTDFSRIFFLESCEVAFFTREALSVGFNKVEHSQSIRWFIENHDFIRDAHLGFLAEPLCFAWPTQSEPGITRPLRFPPYENDVIDNNEIEFWLKYMEFCAITYKLAEQLVGSVSDQLITVSDKIRLRLAGAQQAIQVFEQGYDFDPSQIFIEIIADVDSSYKGLKALISSHYDALKRSQLTSYLSCHHPDNTTRETVLKSCQKLCDITKSLEDVGTYLEEFGTQVSGKIFASSATDIIKKKFEGLKEESLKGDDLERIREHLLIMDIMSEGSLPDTKEAIFEEIKCIDADISAVVVNVQGFDLARQILEHRIAETDVLKVDLPGLMDGSIFWMETQAKLMEKINQKMVTDQEKSSFGFYFSEAAAALSSKKSASPGDIMFL